MERQHLHKISDRLLRWVMWSCVGLVNLLVVLSPSFLLALDVPPLTGRVVDVANVLPAQTESSLNSELAAHESKTSNQVAVLVLPSLEGEPLEDFSHRVATEWHLGQKGTDNGVLLLVAIQERKIRIEVGYGLEGTLTDLRSAHIIRHDMVPRFRAGHLSEGISAGVRAILGSIEGTYVADQSRRPISNNGMSHVFEIMVLAIAVGTILGVALGARRLSTGGLSGGIVSWFIALSAGLGLAFLAGGITWVLVGLFTAGRGRSGSPWVTDSGFGWPTGGGSLGRWPGGDVLGGGGFLGGGGDFGGGGASGDW